MRLELNKLQPFPDHVLLLLTSLEGHTMGTKSRTTEVLAAELASYSRPLNRKMADHLVSLRGLIADKESAARARAESFSDSQKASISEVPEKSRKFLESFLADRGSLL
jgi:hypothetical protein